MVETIIFLKPKSLEVYENATSDLQQLEFPKPIVKALKENLLDDFRLFLTNTLAESGFEAKEAIILLSEISEDGLDVSSFYQIVIEAFEQQGWKIVDVKSSSNFGQIDKKTLSDQVVAQILGESLDNKLKDSAHKVNPGSTQPEFYPAEEKSPAKRGMTTYLLIGLLFLTLVTTGYFILHLAGFKLPGKSVPTPVPAHSPLTSALPSPTPAPANKEDLTFSISNGSGITGQAGKIKQALVAKGYQNLTTSNAQDTITGSTVIFSSKVSDADKQRISDTLKVILNNLTIQSGTLGSSDVQITTGQ